jgi:threonine dehydrogenase-like Zn-dependent dehydrogenase
MLSALIHKAHGAQVLALDVLENRRALARSLGLATGDPHDSNVRDLLPAGAEVVVDCTGVPSVAAKAAEWIKELPWGAPVNASRTLLIQGSYDDKGCISLPYFPSFMNELKILVPRDHTSSDTHAILALLASGRLNFAPLLSRIARPEGAAGVYAELREKGTDLLTAAFNWRG